MSRNTPDKAESEDVQTSCGNDSGRGTEPREGTGCVKTPEGRQWDWRGEKEEKSGGRPVKRPSHSSRSSQARRTYS